MAVIYDGITCPICNKEIDLKGDIFATTAFLMPEHPLWEFSDAAMHTACFENWPHRAEFNKALFQVRVESERDNPYWGVAYKSEKVFVTVNPDPHVAEVSVSLADTGTEFRIPLRFWGMWVRGGKVLDFLRSPSEAEAIRKVMPHLKNALPNSAKVVSSVDWAAKQVVLERDKERTREREEERLRKTKAFNKACRALLRDGVQCPYCHSRDVTYIDKSPKAKSSFVCDKCEQSFGPIDVKLKELYG